MTEEILHRPKYWIGIDPGVNTGFALWDRECKMFRLIGTYTFWKVISLLGEYSRKLLKLVVVIEDVTQNKPTFFRSVNVKGMEKISQNVGSNKRDCQLIIEYCEENGIQVIRSRPNKKSLTKLTQDVFQKITGYTGRLSQHGRDAALLVFDK